jgi:hypothetical protein
MLYFYACFNAEFLLEIDLKILLRKTSTSHLYLCVLGQVAEDDCFENGFSVLNYLACLNQTGLKGLHLPS